LRGASSLPSSLVELATAALSRPDVPWTAVEVKNIAGRLLDQKADAWHGADLTSRLILLQTRPMPMPLSPDLKSFAYQVQVFRALTKCGQHVQKTRTPTPDEFVHLMKPLLHRYNRASAEAYARYMSDVEGVLLSAASDEARAVYEQFKPRWRAIVDDHPFLRALCDPVYVAWRPMPANFGAPLPIWPPHPYLLAGAAIPPAGQQIVALPAFFNGSPITWQFPDRDSALNYVSVLKTAFPAETFHIFDMGVNPAEIY